MSIATNSAQSVAVDWPWTTMTSSQTAATTPTMPAATCTCEPDWEPCHRRGESQPDQDAGQNPHGVFLLDPHRPS